MIRPASTGAGLQPISAHHVDLLQGYEALHNGQHALSGSRTGPRLGCGARLPWLCCRQILHGGTRHAGCWSLTACCGCVCCTPQCLQAKRCFIDNKILACSGGGVPSFPAASRTGALDFRPVIRRNSSYTQQPDVPYAYGISPNHTHPCRWVVVSATQMRPAHLRLFIDEPGLHRGARGVRAQVQQALPRVPPLVQHQRRQRVAPNACGQAGVREKPAFRC